MILGAFIGIGGLGFAHVSNMFLFNTSLPGKFGEYLTRSFCKFLFRFHHHSKSKKPPITRRTNCPISDLCAILMSIGFMSDRIRIRDPGKEYLMNSEYFVSTYTVRCQVPPTANGIFRFSKMLSENNLLSTIYFWFALSQDWFPFSTIQRADDASYITRTKVSERHIWSSSMNIRSHDYSLKQKTGSLNRMFEYHVIVMVFVINERNQILKFHMRFSVWGEFWVKLFITLSLHAKSYGA